MTAPSDHQIRATLMELARTEVGLEEALGDGDLSEQLDSVQRLSLVVAIEDHYKICFDPEDEEGVRTIAQAVALIQAKLADLPPAPEDADAG